MKQTLRVGCYQGAGGTGGKSNDTNGEIDFVQVAAWQAVSYVPNHPPSLIGIIKAVINAGAELDNGSAGNSRSGVDIGAAGASSHDFRPKGENTFRSPG